MIFSFYEEIERREGRFVKVNSVNIWYGVLFLCNFASCFRFMKNFCVFSIILLILSSCSPYQNALKSDDIALKYKVADSLYETGKYKK